MPFEFVNNRFVGDVLASVCWDSVIVDDMEGVGPIDSFSNSLGTYTNALAEAAHLVGVRSGPDGRKTGVHAELVVLEVLASLFIEERYCPHAD